MHISFGKPEVVLPRTSPKAFDFGYLGSGLEVFLLPSPELRECGVNQWRATHLRVLTEIDSQWMSM